MHLCLDYCNRSSHTSQTGDSRIGKVHRETQGRWIDRREIRINHGLPQFRITEIKIEKTMEEKTAEGGHERAPSS